MSLDQAISNLVNRLEQVTQRLESVEKQIAKGAVGGGGAAASTSSASAGDDGSVSAYVTDYDDLINTYIKPLVQHTAKVGNDEVKKQVASLEQAVNAQRAFLAIASKSKKPTDQNALQKLLEPTTKLMGEVVAVRDKARGNKQFNHLSALSEGVPALGWVVVTPTPGPFVDEARAASEFYSNKLLVEFKKSDPEQIEWVHSWNNFLKELKNYIKKHHTTELAWNPRGGDASSAPAAKSGGPPPPPAGGPPPPPPPVVAAPAGGAPNVDALFAEINRGGDVTKGLKKVTKDMKTSNLKDKSSLVKAEDAKPKGKQAAAAAGASKKGPPKIALEGIKWVVEYADNNPNIEINDTEPKHAIYIYKTDHSVIKVKGKINSIVLDNCKRTAVVFDTAISGFEIVNCTSVEVQVTGKVPNVAIDKSQGIQVILPETSLHTEIVTSKSSEMNIVIPSPKKGEDPIELPVPEQYKTLIKDGKLHTNTVEHV